MKPAKNKNKQRKKIIMLFWEFQRIQLKHKSKKPTKLLLLSFILIEIEENLMYNKNKLQKNSKM